MVIESLLQRGVERRKSSLRRGRRRFKNKIKILKKVVDGIIQIVFKRWLLS